MLRTAAARTGIGERRFDRGSPRLSLQLPDGSRLFALMAVAARPCLSIRRHRYLRITPDDLIKLGTIDSALREFVRAAMLARKSCIICGGTGAGKTTLLRAMAADIPPVERLVTIEDSLELGLDRFPDLHPDVVALRPASRTSRARAAVSLAELVRWALRMSPGPGDRRRSPGRGSPGPTQRHVAGHRRVDGHPARVLVTGCVLQAGHLRGAGPRAAPVGGHQPAGGQCRAFRDPPGPRRRAPLRRLGPRGGRRRRANGDLQRDFRPGPDGRPCPAPRCATRPSTSWPRSVSTPACWTDRRAGGRRERAWPPSAAPGWASAWCW